MVRAGRFKKGNLQMAKTRPTVSTRQVTATVAAHFEALPKKMTKEMINSFLEHIEEGVIGGNKVRLDKLGIVQARDRKARMGRNPQTGETIKIPASKKIGFRAAKSLKDACGASRKKTSATSTKKKK